MENKEKTKLESLREPEHEAGASREHLPPRIVKHAGKKSKATRYYSITLVWIFFLLTIFLIVWGYRNS